VLAVGRDLDFYKQRESEDTKRNEQYLRALLDTFPFIVWMKDKAGRFLANNAKFCEVVGVKDYTDLEGKTDVDFFPLEMAQGYMDDDVEVLRAGKPKNVIERITKANGEVYWAETYKSPVKLDGDVIGTVGFARDITEKLKLQSEVTRRNNEYHSLVENLPVAIVRYDIDCKRVFANGYCYSAGNSRYCDLGKRPDEDWNPAISNMTGQEYLARLQDVLKTRWIQMFELRGGEGGLIVYQVKLVPELDEQKNAIGVIAIANDVTENVKAVKKIEHMAYHDELTGLPNRAFFRQRLEVAMQKAKENHQELALMILDLDQFKSINDTMGHAVGDELLVEVSSRMRQSLGERCFCARLGGDEFAVLVESYDSRDALEHLSGFLLQEISQAYSIGGGDYFVSASIGLALYPDDSQDMHDLIKYADSAMYHAKKQGRNRYHLYSPALTRVIQERMQLEVEFRRSLAKKELFLEYQPIVDMENGEIVGMESLCRWENHKLGKVEPARFIQIAEDIGVIAELGLHVMAEAFQAAHVINCERAKPIPVSVNVSAKQFYEASFIEQVQRLLVSFDCCPTWVKFEITESSLLEGNRLVYDALNAFSLLGIQISLDDFGTGQSALAYLNKFPINQIKIDSSFVKEITVNSNDAALVKAIIALVGALKKDLVAEGVETDRQASLLRSYGCRYAQGYLYSKSVSLTSIQAMLE
jgi:diguanylate cyclase (GGDEF)-like protein/PAS domain S-box-containing protein